MAINYRCEFKKFLKNSFRRYKLDLVEQSLKPEDFVLTPLASISNIRVATSRTIDALLDISLPSCSNDRIFESTRSNSRSAIRDIDEFLKQSECRKIYTEKRTKNNGDIEERSTEKNPKIVSICSKELTTPSKNSNFKRRTSHELINMVISQCKLVESLNMISNNTDGEMVLPPSIVLWRSKRKFSSSVDLNSNILQRSKESVWSNEPSVTLSEKLSGTTKRVADMTDEEIVRDQITGPLIREIEQVYVQSITKTAGLLKKLDCMPRDITRVLTRKRKL